MLPAVKKYLREIQKAHAAGKATEHTYRPAFKSLVESFGEKVDATNEPKRVECGAPDFIVEHKGLRSVTSSARTSANHSTKPRAVSNSSATSKASTT